MKLSPFKLYLKSLKHGAARLGLVRKEIALEQLKKITGQDFGYDIEKWSEWGIAHPEISEGPATWAAMHQKPED